MNRPDFLSIIPRCWPGCTSSRGATSTPRSRGRANDASVSAIHSRLSMPPLDVTQPPLFRIPAVAAGSRACTAPAPVVQAPAEEEAAGDPAAGDPAAGAEEFDHEIGGDLHRGSHGIA